MRIKTIEYENFRNFKDHGCIKCSTDGKVTIIYGKNGDGKTTLHQLFQWVFYGEVHFNKTTNDHLYNLELEDKLEYGDVFDVMGRIDFEHDNEQYSLTRTYTYRKGLDDSEKISENLTLTKMDEDYNWKPMPRAHETIEKLLPSGLSEYFFFDGESMIADLRVKGKDSAGKLRKALYSMFDLDIIESAISHIGRTDLKTTALGKLYITKGSIASGSDISITKSNIENAQGRIETDKSKIDALNKEKKEKADSINKISEKIGSSKSKAEYEKERKNLQSQRDTFLDNMESCQFQFGTEVMDMFPSLLISKAVKDAKSKIHLKVADSNLPQGLGKRLIAYLLLADTKKCICNRELCDEQREHIRHYLSMMPPKSYTSMYHDFVSASKQMASGYDKDKIESLIKRYLDNQENAEKCEAKIQELDNQEKKSADIEDLVVARQKAENRIDEIDKELQNVYADFQLYSRVLKKRMKEYDELTESIDSNRLVGRKLEVLQEVLQYFEGKLASASEDYSKELENNIQYLLNEMLTSKRSVSVTPEFSVRVTDSYNDESKSEGQFAVVSFAYIGGILKMLQDKEGLKEKEYPLVLDGPFSKLDPDQRQNVVDVIPRFAPQVILFSKDDLHDVISEDKIGRVWTIQSNDEKNIAHVEEGKLWK